LATQLIFVSPGQSIDRRVKVDLIGTCGTLQCFYNYEVSTFRRHRVLTVLFALISLLFMQLAVAGYACPVESRVSEVAAMAEAGMPCAGDMTTVDVDEPGLCHAHCQSAQQAADKVQVSTPVGVMATGFTYTIEPIRASMPAKPAHAPLLSRSTAPPIAVLNCCFRI
jgi:hypothetical protein